MTKKTLKVGLLQQACESDKQINLKLTADLIAKLAAEQTQLVLLQELHATPYFCQLENPENFQLAESIPGPTTDYLAELAKQHNLVIVGSVFERRAAGIYHNTAVVIEKDGSIAGTYRKMHIPDDPGYYEKYYFTPGDKDFFKPIETSAGKLGVLVCWDQWFPEAARIMALYGADLLLYPTAIGWDKNDDKSEQQRQLDAWVTIQRSHAIANGLPVIVANRTGFESEPNNQQNGIQFWGNSFITGPQGELLTQTDQNSTTTTSITLDLSHTEKIRQAWPYLRDRRIDSYKSLLKRYNI